MLAPQAHGGGILEHDGRYYWYGEDKNGETFKPWSLTYAPLATPQSSYPSQQSDSKGKPKIDVLLMDQI